MGEIQEKGEIKTAHTVRMWYSTPNDFNNSMPASDQHSLAVPQSCLVQMFSAFALTLKTHSEYWQATSFRWLFDSFTPKWLRHLYDRQWAAVSHYMYKYIDKSTKNYSLKCWYKPLTLFLLNIVTGLRNARTKLSEVLSRNLKHSCLDLIFDVRASKMSILDLWKICMLLY